MPQTRVLVIDDDGPIRQMVRRVLEGEGYTVTTAADGREALAMMAQERPALVLLDLRMPGMDGWAFAHELQVRAMPLPVVVMTAALEEEPQQWAAQVQEVDFLVKPFGLEDLLTMVRRWYPVSTAPDSMP
jgi:CheY-like chemotaxis protein